MVEAYDARSDLVMRTNRVRQEKERRQGERPRSMGNIEIAESGLSTAITLSSPFSPPASRSKSQVLPKKSAAFAFRVNSASQSLVVISKALNRVCQNGIRMG